MSMSRLPTYWNLKMKRSYIPRFRSYSYSLRFEQPSDYNFEASFIYFGQT